jgi:integrase
VRAKPFKLCSCRDDEGRTLGRQCPKLARSGHGAWWFRLSEGPGLNAKGVWVKDRQPLTGPFRTEKEAAAALAKVANERAQGRNLDMRRSTVAEEWAKWLDSKVNLRPTTRHGYSRHGELYIVPLLGAYAVRDLRHEHGVRFYAAIRRQNETKAADGRTTAGPATIRRIHATVSSFLNDLVRQRVLPHNPFEHVELEVAERPKVQPWEPAELGAFLDAAAGDRLGAMYELMAFAGLRRGEAVGLRWCDVDLEQRVVHIRQEIVDLSGKLVVDKPKTKGSNSRVDLDATTVGTLLEHQLRQQSERDQWRDGWADWSEPFLSEPDRIGLQSGRLLPTCDRRTCSHGLVFTRQDGAALRPEFVTRRMQAIAEKAGLPRKRLHDLRHGAASLQIAAGVDLAIVSKRLRHSSVAITADTYTHLLEGVGRQAAEAASALVPRAARAPQSA